MKLLAGEPVLARHVRDVGMAPGAGRGDDHARQPGAPPRPGARLDLQEGVSTHGVRPAAHARRASAGRRAAGRVSAPRGQQPCGHLRGAHRGHAHRAQDPKPSRLLVAAVVTGQDDVAGSRLVQVPCGEPGQIRDPAPPADRQGVPAVAPGAPGALLGVEHEKIAPRSQATAHELTRRGQPGLPGPDDDDVNNVGGIGGVSGMQVRIRGVHVTIMRHRSRLVRIGAGGHPPASPRPAAPPVARTAARRP